MKKIIIVLFAVLFLFSCSKNQAAFSLWRFQIGNAHPLRNIIYKKIERNLKMPPMTYSEITNLLGKPDIFGYTNLVAPIEHNSKTNLIYIIYTERYNFSDLIYYRRDLIFFKKPNQIGFDYYIQERRNEIWPKKIKTCAEKRNKSSGNSG